jgi:hypothetical protein
MDLSSAGSSTTPTTLPHRTATDLPTTADVRASEVVEAFG